MSGYTKALLQSVDAERLLRERYGIRDMVRRGDELVTPCPLPFGNHKHGDKNPSFAVNTKSGVANCFVCGGGSLVWLVQQMEDKTYKEALSTLQSFQVEMSDEEFAALVESLGREDDERSSLLTSYGADIERWSGNRHEYWAERGLTRQTEARFSLGYSPEHNRVVVPHRFRGEWVGYQMRTLDGKGPKWKNSTDFPRATTLFNYDVARHYESVIVVEAAASAMWLHQLGYPNVVATFGASVTKEQCRLLRYADEVVAWLDPDEAGEHGLALLTADLASHTTVYRLVEVDGDPNDTDADGVQRALDRSNWRMVF